MSAARFITIQSLTASGTLGSLPRVPVLVTREDVTGFTPDSITGLIKINITDQTTFNEDNPTSYGLISALNATFTQIYTYDFVYILSSPSGVTSEELDKANIRPRDWSFLVLVDQYNGDGTGGAGSTDYFTDLGVMATWATPSKQKMVLHTYSVEEVGDSPIVIPSELVLGGDINANPNVKTIVCNSQSTIVTTPSPVTAYDNISLAWLAYNINGPVISRSWGSLSDSHDYAYVDGDSYSIASRNVIANNSLAQYNGAKDLGGQKFVYDTQMNSEVNPPTTVEIETLAAQYYTEDYSYIYVRNALQAPGQTGLTNDDAGIQRAAGLLIQALYNCWTFNCILTQENGQPDFTVQTLTAAQVTALSPDWRQTGTWPAGTVVAKIRYFSATHYITFDFFGV